MFRPEPHVAQHIRREKLRVQDPSAVPQQLDFTAAESSSSYLNPFELAPAFASCGGAAWNTPLLPAAELHYPSFPFSSYTLHEDMGPILAAPPQHDGGNELPLLPSYVTNPPSIWSTRSRSENQGALALSLASNPTSSQLSSGVNRWLPVQGIGQAQPAAGPLGPFTGYAAILKGSKFLKPAQQLLDEFCSAVTGSRTSRRYDGGSSGAASPPSFQSSSEAACIEGCGGNGSYREVHRPEFEHMKTKLLYMQEEVCKRYKQYHRQMQMVVSSFESVAGLSSATPYATLALKAVSKHFRCLKGAISDQLRHVCNVLGEELMASSPSSSKNGCLALPKLKYVDQSGRRQKVGDGNLCFSDNSHPVWRPQRGLPERAVSVLRAWLFDHFLHPYPTDTDKHMLATQTGLSRNQVSNWFINARVRLWKPMVEEIHMLETKGVAGMDLNSSTKPSDRPMEAQFRQQQADDGSASGELIMDNKSSHFMEAWHQEKRSRVEECSMDAGLMGFAYPGTMEMGGLGVVSLTLGLRQGEGLQQQEHQMRHFGQQMMMHDFVG